MSKPTFPVTDCRRRSRVTRARPWARPLAFIYGWGSDRLRERAIVRRGQAPAGVTLISVGNLEVGGSGKTPLAIHLLDRLRERGHRPAYVSRGFSSPADRASRVTLSGRVDGIPPKRAAQWRWVRVDAPDLARQIGDEGAVVADRCADVPLFFCADKHLAVATACEVAEPTHVVIDDAFQTWRLPRHVDIVLLDAARPFGNGWLLPAGTLREPPSALARASMIGFNGWDGAESLEDLRERVVRSTGFRGRVFGLRRRVSWVGGGPAPDGRPEGAVVIVSGIARPDPFERDVMASGADVRAAVRFEDHHDYARKDIVRITTVLEQSAADRVVTTEKDWVKLRALDPPFATCIGRLGVSVEGLATEDLMEEPQAMPAARSREVQ